MNKNSLKMVFLGVALLVVARCMWFGFDIAASAFLLISSGLLFAYDFVAADKKIKELEKELSQLKFNQDELAKDISQMKSARNIQKVNAPSPIQFKF